MYELEIIQTAEKLVREVMGVKEEDKVLVITDVAKMAVGNAFAIACKGLGAETVMALMPLTGEHGNEPPATIAAAMKVADVVFAPTTHAITHTRARLEASKAGARVVILRGVDEDMMIKGGMTVDFQELRERTEKVAQVLSEGDEITVTSIKINHEDSIDRSITFFRSIESGLTRIMYNRNPIGAAKLNSPYNPLATKQFKLLIYQNLTRSHLNLSRAYSSDYVHLLLFECVSTLVC